MIHKAILMLSLQPYSLPSGFSDLSYIVRYEDSQGYANTIYVYTGYYYYSSQTQYTLRGLSLGEVYNVSVRARFSLSYGCYSYLYGEYSNAVTVETVETGNYVAIVSYPYCPNNNY